MTGMDRFLFGRGLGWELTRLFAVFTPVCAFLLITWWLVRSAVE